MADIHPSLSLAAVSASYPTLIACPCQDMEPTREWQHQGDHLCRCLEATLPYLGSVAIALYRDLAPRASALEHQLFLTLERPLLGKWRWLIRAIGEHFCDHCLEHPGWRPWLDYLREYARGAWFDLWEDLVRFRNEFRHGSAALNQEIIAGLQRELLAVLASIAFCRDFPIWAWSDQATYLCQGTVPQPMPWNDEIPARVWLASGQFSLAVAPLLSLTPELELRCQTPGADLAPQEFYQQLQMQPDYADFCRQRQGDYQPPANCSQQVQPWPPLLITAPKILLSGEPGAGKSWIISNLAYLLTGKPMVVSYLIAASPLKIMPLVAMKTLVQALTLTGMLAGLARPQGDKLAAWLEFIRDWARQNQHQQIIIGIDGLFAPQTPPLSPRQQEHWHEILAADYPANICWLVTATRGYRVPRFFSQVIELGPTPMAPTDLDAEQLRRLDNLARGNWQVRQAYLKQPQSIGADLPLPDDLSRYFDRLLRCLPIIFSWQRNTLALLAQKDAPWSLQQLARHQQIFTPKMEKFIDSIRVVLIEEPQGYRLYHPLLSQYIRSSNWVAPA